MNKKGNLKYRDINGMPLLLPTLVFPFRRALYFMSFFAYCTAMESKRGHQCAAISNPTEEVWETIKNTVANDSDCGDELAFISSDEMDSTD